MSELAEQFDEPEELEIPAEPGWSGTPEEAAKAADIASRKRAAVTRHKRLTEKAKMLGLDMDGYAVISKVAQTGLMVDMVWKSIRKVRDPHQYVAKVWPKKIPKMWEELFSVAKARGDVMSCMNILTAMTAMSPLSPKKIANAVKEALDEAELPAGVDVGQLEDELLAKIAGKQVALPGPKQHSRKARAKKAAA